jgi:hypothetical protein
VAAGGEPPRPDLSARPRLIVYALLRLTVLAGAVALVVAGIATAVAARRRA